MNDASGQWLWFLDEELVHTFLNVEPENTQLARRATSHPSVVRAVRLWLGGSADEALQELTPASEEGNSDALLLQGQINFERGRFEAAAESYGALAEIFP